MLRDSIERRLPQVFVPVLVMRGKRDTIVPQHWAEEVSRLARAERLVVIPRKGHALNYSAAEQLVHEILPFLLAATDPIDEKRTTHSASRGCTR